MGFLGVVAESISNMSTPIDDNDDNKADALDKKTNEDYILLSDKNDSVFLYYNKFNILIPMDQPFVKNNKKSKGNAYFIKLGDTMYKFVTVRAEHAKEVFSKLMQVKTIESWDIDKYLWIVDNTQGNTVKNMPKYDIVYNAKRRSLEKLSYRESRALKVIYLTSDDIRHKSELNRMADLGLKPIIPEKNDGSVYSPNDRCNKPKDNDNISFNIQELLDCDKRRCGLASYEREILYDIRAGHWDVYEKHDGLNNDDGKLIGKDPRTDIKKSGVIGIDFGTKSTVVVKQEGKNEIRPIRIGSLSLTAQVEEDDYENPTIISCVSINSFLKKYEEMQGRPETSCEDIFVSYNAYEDYINCSTDNFYAYYADLKQWANREKEEVIIQDIKDKSKYWLWEENSLDEKKLNPIEIYAYYIGMYINNMRNGIYLKYIMSFPVKYSNATKELIRKSFERGIKKSLPATVVEDAECMSKFSVKYEVSEPAAYAVTALELSGFKPEDEKEKYLYGVFDFGGGTTDFDFGVWRGASDNEYDKYNCDYVLECFGADSDVRLGGENILEMLAYHVFKENKKMAAQKKIACALPVDQIAFIGGESLISNSQSANRNLTLLKEALRPLWEQHENWQQRYLKEKPNQSKDMQDIKQLEEYIELQMYDFNGKPVPNCRFVIDTDSLQKIIKQRIEKGVRSFFSCMEKSVKNNKSAKYASEKIYIFLAGNSCKSAFVKELFEENINNKNKEYASRSNKEQDIFFDLIEPLKSYETDSLYIPNAKTSVAYGLVKSRPGGKILVKKNYETDPKSEARFKYYLGNDRRGLFKCKLTPTIKGENEKSEPSYNIWYKFQGAGMGIARIYYTDDPRANARNEKLSIDNIPFHEILFEADEDKYLFIRAIKPSVIEYAIAESKSKINGSVIELNIDSSN